MTDDTPIRPALPRDSMTRSAWVDCVGIALVATLLLIAGQSVSARRHIRAIVDNDAVGYTTAARSLARTGKLTSHVVYPSTLSQPATKSTLYMPGFYWALAGIYRVFGFGVTQSIFASQASLVIAAIGTYLTGLRLFDRRIAILAAGLFLIYPANLYFAATAMSELPLVAASAVAFCAFVHLPRRVAPYVGPILLAGPFLFRETGAFLALPMAIVLFCDDTYPFRSRLGRATALAALSIVVLGAIYMSPISSGRPSLIKLDIFINETGAENIYRNALSGDRIHPIAGEWARTLWGRFIENSGVMLGRLLKPQHQFVVLALLPLASAIPLGFTWGALKRDAVALGAASLVLLTLIFVCMFYSVRHDRPVRVAMFAMPLVVILQARIVSSALAAMNAKFSPVGRFWSAALGSVAIIAWVASTCFHGFTEMAVWDIPDDRAVAFVEHLNHDDKTTLVAPHLLGVPYISRHFPATFAFLPANGESLRLLCSKYDVTTLIYDPRNALDLKAEDIVANGLRKYRSFRITSPERGEEQLIVYRRPKIPGEQDQWTPDEPEEIKWLPWQLFRH